ncbi:hypothetical protein DFH09DRAFT_1084356 [Mycena vulgaris]|nr:hypothetical protein DFH09DRAFT_1084356 [Mycena vulgaris]
MAGIHLPDAQLPHQDVSPLLSSDAVLRCLGQTFTIEGAGTFFFLFGHFAIFFGFLAALGLIPARVPWELDASLRIENTQRYASLEPLYAPKNHFNLKPRHIDRRTWIEAIWSIPRSAHISAVCTSIFANYAVNPSLWSPLSRWYSLYLHAQGSVMIPYKTTIRKMQSRESSQVKIDSVILARDQSRMVIGTRFALDSSWFQWI